MYATIHPIESFDASIRIEIKYKAWKVVDNLTQLTFKVSADNSADPIFKIITSLLIF